MSKISVVIPAYNEESSIKNLLKEIDRIVSNKAWEVIVVDDGSSDKTSEIVQQYKFVKLVRHPYNKGYGASLKTGINNSIGEKIILLDADNQHDPSDIEIILSYLEDYDLVVGTRDKSNVSGWSKQIGNFILKKLASFLVDMEIPDLTSGFRGFKKEKILKLMHLYPNGFSFSATNILSFICAGYDVKFTTIKVKPRNKSRSKIRLVKDGAKFFLLILRIITLFNPLKIFFPISLLFFLVGMIYLILYLFLIRSSPTGAILLILSSFIIFFFGLIADQISCLRREIK